MNIKLNELWEEKWWLKNKWRNQFTIPDKEYGEQFSILENEFDSSWVNSIDRNAIKHPVIRNICFGEGLHQISNLLQIASFYKNLKQIEGFERVSKEFKNAITAKNAEFELFMANLLYTASYNVSFIKPGPKKGKTPDILATYNDKHFVVECKFLSNAKGEKWVRRYSIEYANELTRSIPKGYAIKYKLLNPFFDIRKYGYPDNLTSSVLAAKIETLPIVNLLKQLIADNQIPRVINLQDEGLLVWSKETDEFRTTIEMPEVDNNFIIKRLINNGVIKASEQIQTYGIPGIVAIFQEKSTNLTEVSKNIHALFESVIKKYSKVMGVIIFRTQNILEYIEPFFIRNLNIETSVEEFNFSDAVEPLLRYKEVYGSSSG